MQMVSLERRGSVQSPIRRDLDRDEVALAPIFEVFPGGVGQALYVSFLMETLPVRERGQLDRMVSVLMREAGIIEAPACERDPRAVNFSGLSPEEVRGQCAMVRAIVDDHLPGHERDVVHATYGYQVRKAGGVRGVVRYVEPLLFTHDPDALLAMGWGVFGSERQKKDFAGVAIAREWGLAARTVQADMKKIRMKRDSLMYDAIERLRVVLCSC
jgi:hypothetical protein